MATGVSIKRRTAQTPGIDPGDKGGTPTHTQWERRGISKVSVVHCSSIEGRRGMGNFRRIQCIRSGIANGTLPRYRPLFYLRRCACRSDRSSPDREDRTLGLRLPASQGWVPLPGRTQTPVTILAWAERFDSRDVDSKISSRRGTGVFRSHSRIGRPKSQSEWEATGDERGAGRERGLKSPRAAR